MRELGKAELSISMLAFLKLTTPLLAVNLAFSMARCNGKLSESCRKDVKRLSETNKILCRVATVTRLTVNASF